LLEDRLNALVELRLFDFLLFLRLPRASRDRKVTYIDISPELWEDVYCVAKVRICRCDRNLLPDHAGPLTRLM
jgi:hypothetical protein